MAYFGRSDWQYVHTNGAQGSAKGVNISVMFPWAGEAVMKSGLGRNDTWAFFDVGPYGSSGHAHRDKLTFNLRAFGSMLLVDSGRFAYNGNSFSHSLRPYAASNP